MADCVPVRCPECSREHTYTPPVYPCDCGAPVALPLARDAVPAQVRHRTWEGSWVEVRCPSCGKSKEWPQPELGCGCGALLRMPVVPPQPGPEPAGRHGATASPEAAPGPAGPAPAGGEAGAGTAAGDGCAAGTAAGDGCAAGAAADDGGSGLGGSGPAAGGGAGSGGSGHEGAGSSPAPASVKPQGAQDRHRPPRPAFRPVTIRTAQDARTAAAEYLRWLGFPEVRVTERRPSSGVDVRGAGIVAHVDPTTAPTTVREVETLWLNGLNEDVESACFSLAGYSREARTRADSLCVPLFVLDLTGMPQAVNDPADDLVRSVC